jgi:quinol monooxygenase YgiN
LNTEDGSAAKDKTAKARPGFYGFQDIGHENPEAYAVPFGVESICRIAQFQVQESFLERCEEAVRNFVRHVKQNEPGTILYISFQSKQDRTQFVHFMVFENAEALAKHGLSSESKRLIELIHPHLLSHIASSNFERVAST